MGVDQVSCKGFTKCQALDCENGFHSSVNGSGATYTPNDVISLVEEQSGSMLGTASSQDNLGGSAMILDLSCQSTFTQDFQNIPYQFKSRGVGFQVVNVEKVDENSWKKVDGASLNIGVNNPVAILVTTRSGDVIKQAGLLEYVSNGAQTTSNPLDGLTVVNPNVNLNSITSINFLWYIFRKNNINSEHPLRYGEFIALVAKARSVSINANPKNKYTGGVMQKNNTAELPNSCLNFSDGNKDRRIVFMVNGQNNLLPNSNEPSNAFAKGNIPFCTDASCGNCSLAFFQVASLNGCIKGNSTLAGWAIFLIVLLGFVVLIIICFYIYRRLKGGPNKEFTEWA